MKAILKWILGKSGFEIKRIKIKEKNIRSKRSNNLNFYQTKTGNYYLPDSADADVIVTSIKSGKIFEKEVVDLASKYIKPETIVLDVGSNFGQMAILFSRMVGEAGKVHAFDADDFVFSVLEKNINANSLTGKVIPHFGAVHHVENEVLYFPVQDFERFGSYGSYGIDYKGQKGREVKSLTIDGLNIQEPVSFMKVDVQGGDLMAMQGAKQTILRNKMPILFEYEYHFEDELNLCFQDYVDFVAEIGYKFEKVINGHNFLIVPK